MADVALLFAFLAAGIAFSLLLWQAVQGEGRGETMHRRDAEQSARRDRSGESGTDGDEDPEWGAAARRDRD